MRIRNSDDPAVPGWVLRVVLVGAVLVLAGAATPQGAVAVANVQYFLNYYAGVFALIAYTTAVMSGLLATERLILQIRHRVLAQALHRASAVVVTTMLVAHVSVKVMAGLAPPIRIVVPSAGAIGLGTIAADLLILIVITGMLRARFAFRGKAWLWRSMHVLAYASWPLAIMHGLTAGRAAASWVVLSYVLSVVFVVLALITRIVVLIKPRELPRAGDEIDGFSRPDGAGRRRDRRAMAEMEHEDARAAAAARDGYDDRYDDARAVYDRAAYDRAAYDRAAYDRDAYDRDAYDRGPRATAADPRGMPLTGQGGRDTEVLR